MKKKVIKIVSVCVVLILAFLYAHIDKNVYLYDRNADTSIFVNTGILQESENISQTFVAAEDTIDGINIKVSIAGDVENIVLHCAIKDDVTGELQEATVKGGQLKNNKFNQIELPQITHAKGKQYTLIIYADNCDEQNGVSFYIDPTHVNGQDLYVKGNETQGILIARTICHRFDVETFLVLLGILGFITVFLKVLYKLFK